MLDFTELSEDGHDLEVMTRELLFSLGYPVAWSGAGPDGGRDLTVTEPGDQLFGSQARKWLVSCKDFARSGRSVGVNDLTGFVDACQGHGAEGFLLVCTTHPSAGLITRLEGVQNEGHVRTHYWDGVALERLLSRPTAWAIAQRFMPQSTIGWQVWATEKPNHFLASYRGHYLHLVNRHASGSDFTVQLAGARVDLAEEITAELPHNHLIRLRAIWWDDKHGSEVTYVDYLRPRGQEPSIEPAALLDAFDHEATDEFGQASRVDLGLVETNPGSDAYDIDHYSYYTELTTLLPAGAERADAREHRGHVRNRLEGRSRRGA
jgi:hypothetical protein